MIDPENITKYNRTERELEIFWLFCLATAGKNADYAARAVSKIVRAIRPEYETPFEQFAYEPHMVHNILVTSAVGQYARMEHAIEDTVRLLFVAVPGMVNGTAFRKVSRVASLRDFSVEQLEEIHGVGPKTARFFVLHSRPGARCMPLDTHILAWLKELGVKGVPSATPSNMGVYRALEAEAMALANAIYPELPLADADLLIWRTMSGRLDVQEDPPPVDMSRIHNILGRKK